MSQNLSYLNIKDLLIYPAGKEPPIMEPFSTLYNRFENQIRDSNEPILVIGFSFRDLYLIRHFREFINKGGQILVMSMNCLDTVATNLFGMKEKDDLKSSITRKHIIPMQCHFGESDWNINLVEALKNLF